MSIRVEEVDTRVAPDDLLREMHEFYLQMDEEMLPGDPPMPFERRAADWRQIRSDHVTPRWLLRIGGEIVASAVAWLNLEQDLDNGFGWIFVLPDLRGEGHARRLSAVLFECLQGHRRKRLNTYARAGHPAEGALRAAGMKLVYREKRSRLAVDDVDMPLMRSWIERGSERARDYELLPLRIPFPDDAVERYCELQFQMNTAPMEDVERDDEVLEPRIWREQEEQTTASGHDLLTYVAVHGPTGQFVGSTSVQTDRLYPEQAWQFETVVHPDHRNKGLGRLLKASMIERVVADWPVVERIDTFNAGSNEPMLNINVAMGFRPIQSVNGYQGELATVRERLAV